MIGRTSRVFLEVVAATLLGVLLLGAAAAWRLSQGPVSLTFLTPAIEEALNQQSTGLRIEIGDTNLAWAGWERTLDIRAVDARALTADGRSVVSVPEISISLSARALLQGIVAPTRLELIGPRLRLVRTGAGQFELAFEDTGAMSEDQTRRLVRGLLPASGKNSALTYLTRVSVIGAKLTVDDRSSGTVWGSPRADIMLWRDGIDLRAGIDMDIDLGGDRPARLRGDAVYRPGEKKISVDARFSRVRADLLAQRLTSLRGLEMVRLAFDGRATVEMDSSARLLSADFEVSGGNGRLAPSVYWPDGLAVKSLTARGRLQQNPDFAVLDEVTLDTGGPTITGNGVIMRVGGNAAINAHAVMRDMPISALSRYWPHNLAPKQRRWVTANLKDGTVGETRMEISAHAGLDGKGGVGVDSLNGTLQFEGATIHYLKPLPPARKVSGSAAFDLQRFIFTIAKGSLNGINSESGRVSLTKLDTDNEHAQIELVLRGPLQSALRLIDHPEFKLAGRVGIDAGATTGEMATRLVLDFPLGLRVSLDEVNIAAASNLRDVTVPDFIRGHGITDGVLTLRVDKTGLEVKGTAKLGPAAVALEWYEDFEDTASIRRRYRLEGTLNEEQRKALGMAFSPYLRGPVDVEASLLETARGSGEAAVKLGLKPATLEIPLSGWSKPSGAEGIAWLTLRLGEGRTVETIGFDVRTAGLKSNGSVAFARGDKPFQVVVRQFVAGANDVSGRITERADGGYDVVLEGSRLDAAPFLRFDDDDGAATDLPPLYLSTRLDRMWYGPGAPVDNIVGTLSYDGKAWREIDLNGTLGDVHRITLRLGGEGPVRKMWFSSSNAGVALRRLGFFENIRDGAMIISGERDASKADAPWQGRLMITDFRLVDAPLLARILSLASLTGFVDAIQGQGIAFARFDMPYTFKDKLLVVKKARSLGSALGFTATGKIDFGRDVLKLNGTVVPASTLNTMFGKIPLLGPILTGSEGGVFGVTYRIDGPLKEPTVTVNPLSALAPGVLRDLLGVLTGSGGEQPPGQPSETAPTEEYE